MFALRSTRAAALAMASAAMLASITVPFVAQAAEPTHDKMMQTPKSYAEFMKMDPAECMKMIDHDNKGYVTKEEYMRFHEAFWPRRTPTGSPGKSGWARSTHTRKLGQLSSGEAGDNPPPYITGRICLSPPEQATS